MMQICDMTDFLCRLLGRCDAYRHTASLTLTAIHPDGQHPTPSRHILFGNRAVLHDALECLDVANRCGWGAFFGVGLRKAGLGRWKRGGTTDVVALPAFYTDIDDPTDTTLMKLRGAGLPPSMIVHSGGGYHAYWMLDEPTHDLHTAGQVLQGLARVFGGDHLSVAQSLRLPGTRNSKRSRDGALCRLVDISERHYHPSDFQSLMPPMSCPPSQRLATRASILTRERTLNVELVNAITAILYGNYAARDQQRSDWLPALCPCGHARDSPGAHFFFNPIIGCARCHGRHGTLRLTDLCPVLGIDAATYGGVYH